MKKISLLATSIVVLLTTMLVSCGSNGASQNIGLDENAMTINTIISVPNDECYDRVKANNETFIYSTKMTSDDILMENFYCYSKGEQDYLIYSVDNYYDDVLDFFPSQNDTNFFLVLETSNHAENIYLKKITDFGKTIENITLLNDFYSGENDNCYTWKIALSPNNNILIYSGFGYRFLDSNGNLIEQKKWEESRYYEIT